MATHWFKTRVPDHSRERPLLLQSAHGLHRSTPDASYPRSLRFSSPRVGRRPMNDSVVMTTRSSLRE
jgi:hypothetical protein